MITFSHTGFAGLMLAYGFVMLLAGVGAWHLAATIWRAAILPPDVPEIYAPVQLPEPVEPVRLTPQDFRPHGAASNVDLLDTRWQSWGSGWVGENTQSMPTLAADLEDDLEADAEPVLPARSRFDSLGFKVLVDGDTIRGQLVSA